MRYEYYFCDIYQKKHVDFLEKNHISYKLTGKTTSVPLIYFSLWSNDINLENLLCELKSMNIRDPLISVVYTEAEIKRAKLLWMRPKKQCIDIINYEDSYEYSCTWENSFGIKKVKHMEQKGLFAIAKEPSVKGRTAFWAESIGFAEVFTDRRVVDLADNNQLSGIDFKNVMLRKGNYSENIFQMTSSNIIPLKCIALGHGEKQTYCHICGKMQLDIDNAYQLHLDFKQIDMQSDLYMTESIFGPGIAEPLYLISQKFYQLLKDNKLTGGVTFAPVAESE